MIPMQKWMLLALSWLLSSCQLIAPASLDGLFAETSDAGTTAGSQSRLMDSADPDTGSTACSDTGGDVESGACGDYGGGTVPDDDGTADGNDTGEPEPVPCSEDISLRLRDGARSLRLDLTAPRPDQPSGQTRQSAVQIPAGADGANGAWLVGHGPDFLIGVRLPPGKALAVRLDPTNSITASTPDHLVAFLDGCPDDPDLCSSDDPTGRSGDCISEIHDGRWWTGAGEGWQASLENPSEDELYMTLLVDTTSPLELEGGDLVYEMTDL